MISVFRDDLRLMVSSDVSWMGFPEMLRCLTFLKNGEINKVLTPSSVNL